MIDRKIVYHARRHGRDTGYALLHEIKNMRPEDEALTVGEWRFIRPTTWLPGVLLEGDNLSVVELKEVDQHWLAALNTILTPVGWKAIINGKWNDGHLIITRVKGKA